MDDITRIALDRACRFGIATIVRRENGRLGEHFPDLPPAPRNRGHLSRLFSVTGGGLMD